MENTEDIPDREFVMEERSFHIQAIDGTGTKEDPYMIDGVSFNGWYYEMVYDVFLHCVDGVIHSDTSHAIVGSDGTKRWFCQGQHHRPDGPAVVKPDGSMSWWVHDVLHRLDGPAVVKTDGCCEWWVDGKEIDIVSVLGYEPTIPLSSEEQLILRLSV